MGSLKQVVHLIQQLMILSFITFVVNHQCMQCSHSESVYDTNHHRNLHSYKDNNNYLDQSFNTYPDHYCQTKHVHHLQTCINHPLNQYPDHDINVQHQHHHLKMPKQHLNIYSNKFNDFQIIINTMYYQCRKIKYYNYKTNFKYITIHAMIYLIHQRSINKFILFVSLCIGLVGSSFVVTLHTTIMFAGKSVGM